MNAFVKVLDKEFKGNTQQSHLLWEQVTLEVK